MIIYCPYQWFSAAYQHAKVKVCMLTSLNITKVIINLIGKPFTRINKDTFFWKFLNPSRKRNSSSDIYLE